MKEWMTAAEIAAMKLPGVPKTRWNITAKATREHWPFRERQGRGGGREYPLSALPEAARLALQRQTLRHAAASAPILSETLAPFQSEAATLPLDPRAQERADAKIALLSAFHDFRTRYRLPILEARIAFCTGFQKRELAIEEKLYTQLRGLSSATLKLWQQQLRQGGPARLAGRYGKRAGACKIDQTPEVKTLILGMLANFPHASAKHVMRALKVRVSKEQLPAYRSLQRWLMNWKAENAQLFTAISNPDRWRSHYAAAGGDADAGILRLNQLWEFDSTPADLLLADGARHSIIGVIDVYSRRLKFRVSRTSKATAIAGLLRAAILDWGVPEAVKTDNGADYVSRHLTRVFQALEIRQEVCPPFTPQAKPHIERAFRTFSHDLVELLQGYIGHNVAERKDIEARRSFAERLMKRGGEAALEMRMTPEELQTFCDRWTDQLYGREPHSGIDGKTPFLMAAEWRQSLRRIENERALDILLSEAPGDGGWRTITKKGLRIESALFEAPELGGYEGQKVKVLLDEADCGAVFVFREDNTFLARAICPERVGVSRKELAAARKQRQKAVIQEARRALKEAAAEIRAKDIVADILADQEKQAARLAAFPKSANAHETPALRAAAKAGLGPRVIRELTVEEKAEADRRWAALTQSQPADIIPLPAVDPSGRPIRFESDEAFARWVMAHPEIATDEDRAYLHELLQSKSFRLLLGVEDGVAAFGNPARSRKVVA